MSDRAQSLLAGIEQVSPKMTTDQVIALATAYAVVDLVSQLTDLNNTLDEIRRVGIS